MAPFVSSSVHSEYIWEYQDVPTRCTERVLNCVYKKDASPCIPGAHSLALWFSKCSLNAAATANLHKRKFSSPI